MKSVTHWDPFTTGIAMPETGRWDPFKDAGLDLISGFFAPVARRRTESGAPMDVAETSTAYYLAVDLPGTRKEAIGISVLENSITISAEIAEEKQAGEEPTWLLRERTFGKIERSVTLPHALDESASEAKYADGVLYLKLQKKNASQVKRLAVH